MSEDVIIPWARRHGFAQMLAAMMARSGETFTLMPTEELVGNPMLPALHGGAIASFLEMAAQLALAPALAPGQSCRLISVNLQFLAPARQVAIQTTPKVIRVGRRIAVVHAEAVERSGTCRLCSAQMEFAIQPAAGNQEPMRRS